MSDRPHWPPGAEITAQAYDMFDAWERKWSDDLEGVDSIMERVAIYDHMNNGIDIDLAKVMAASDYANR